jgi:hypothetical protein
MNKYGFPRGNPAEDCRKLQAWWGEEMQKCGLSGNVAVQHSQVTPQAPGRDSGKSRLEVLLDILEQRQAAAGTHLHVAAIPGAPWPLETAVMTTNSGTITKILYHAVLPASISAEVCFKRVPGFWMPKLGAVGPGAERFKDMKPLLKKIGNGLSFRYKVPQWGFVTSKRFLEFEQASVLLRPCREGTEALVQTTVCEQTNLFGAISSFSLGLGPVIEILKAIEHPEWAPESRAA